MSTRTCWPATTGGGTRISSPVSFLGLVLFSWYGIFFLSPPRASTTRHGAASPAVPRYGRTEIPRTKFETRSSVFGSGGGSASSILGLAKFNTHTRGHTEFLRDSTSAPSTFITVPMNNTKIRRIPTVPTYGRRPSSNFTGLATGYPDGRFAEPLAARDNDKIGGSFVLGRTLYRDKLTIYE